MDSYNFSDIDDRADCREIYEALVGPLSRDGRGAATWRGGTNPASVSFADDGKKWHDHGSESGGGSIKLVEAIRDCSMPEAASWLGNYYNLEPRNYAPRSPVQALLDEGYTETCRYDYQDAGELVLQVVRFTHPDKGKTFRQYDPVSKRWRGHKDPPLYNEVGLAGQNWACIVEGEKDADTLIARGWPAVTAAGGSKKWLERHSQALAGLNVVIIADNDEAGQAHALLVARSVRIYAQTIRIVTISAQAKGDVTDYFEAGGTAEALAEVIKASPELGEKDLSDDAAAKAAAKLANQTPFRNYYMKDSVNSAGKPCKGKAPRGSGELMEDFFTRFCGAPYSCGDTLFDHDHDSREIYAIPSAEHLFSWISDLVKFPADWHCSSGYSTKGEFFRGVQKAATEFKAIRTIPEHPRRENVYYNVPDLPAPTPGYARFRELIAFFQPLNPQVDGPMLAAMFLAPLYPLLGGKPLFVVDSERRGSGKTTTVSVSALLLGREVVEVSHQSLKRDEQELTNRLITSSARDASQVLIDNVDGSTASISGALSAAITRKFISGRPKYGRDEVSRPNDLTYYMTVNNATLTDDLAVRAYFVHLGYPKGYDETFRSRVEAFTRKHRLQILADMLAMLENHTPFPNVKAYTRFPEFETTVLQAACGDIDTFSACVEQLAVRREEANVDEERGKMVDDHFQHRLRGRRNIDPKAHVVFIRSQVALEWAREVCGPSITLADLRDLAKSGHSKSIAGKVSAWPESRAAAKLNIARRRGILWSPPDAESKKVQYLVRKEGSETVTQGIAP